MCRSCYRSERSRYATNLLHGRYVVDHVLYDDDESKRLLIFKRFIDKNGHVRGKPIPLFCDLERSKSYFVPKPKADPRCKTLSHWVCPFRVKWDEFRAKKRAQPKRGRRLCPELAEARELTQAPFTSRVLDDERRLVSQYIHDKASKVLVFKNEDNEVFAKPYEYRYSPGRVARVRRRFATDVKPRLKCEKDFLFVTLTTSTRRFKSQYEAYDYVSSKFDSFMSSVRKLVKKKFHRRVEFVRSYEWQENGVGCHVHVLLVGVHWLNADWVREIWGETNKRSVQLDWVRNWKKAYYYVLKYNLKDVEADESGDNLSVSQVVNLAVGARSYGLSRGFSSLGTSTHNSDSDSSEKWVFLGQVDLETYNNLSVGDLLRYFGYG